MLLILDMQIIVSGDEVGDKIGSPTVLGDIGPSDQVSSSSGSEFGHVSSTSAAKTSAMNGSASSATNGLNLSNQMTYPISSLSPYHNK